MKLNINKRSSFQKKSSEGKIISIKKIVFCLPPETCVCLLFWWDEASVVNTVYLILELDKSCKKRGKAHSVGLNDEIRVYLYFPLVFNNNCAPENSNRRPYSLNRIDRLLNC